MRFKKHEVTGQLARLLQEHGSVRAAAAALGVAETVVHAWLRAGGPSHLGERLLHFYFGRSLDVVAAHAAWYKGMEHGKQVCVSLLRE